jgi:predicted glycoside hydrolase/deacetylase ChbG (UPF0249 family)
MRNILLVRSLLFGLFINTLASAQSNKIRLLVRSDDMASCHAANESCIKVVKEGICRSVEVMVPCPWYREAVQMLNQNPGIDVGIHLTLNSEWDEMKWGPITPSPTLTDFDGNFPMRTRYWHHKNYKMAEMEAELRKQIEMAMSEIPNVTHISSHMWTADVIPEITNLVKKLAKEYKLIYQPEGLTFVPEFGWDKVQSLKEKENVFVAML